MKTTMTEEIIIDEKAYYVEYHIISESEEYGSDADGNRGIMEHVIIGIDVEGVWDAETNEKVPLTQEILDAIWDKGYGNV